MKAVIKSDPYECPRQVESLKRRLLDHRVEPVFISSISEMPSLLSNLASHGDEPFLYLSSPWEWVDFPDQIIELHCKDLGFENIDSQDNTDIFTYIPSRVYVHNDRLLNIRERFGKVYTFSVNVKKSVTRPQVDPPRVFVTSHNRHSYLELTLNSLLSSIDESVPVTILLNHPTPQVIEVAMRQKRSNLDVLEIEKNCFYSSINLGVQWYRPETFMICEDDFIIPPSAKEYYPDWVYHFVQRLNHCDMVGWSPSIDNAPAHHRFPRDKNPIGEWTIGGMSFSNYPLLLGNCLAVKSSFWIESLRNQRNDWHTPLDTTLHNQARSYCTPSLKGYHIGWNQQVDGFGSLDGREFVPVMDNTVTNLKTKESRRLSLDNIYR